MLDYVYLWRPIESDREKTLEEAQKRLLQDYPSTIHEIIAVIDDDRLDLEVVADRVTDLMRKYRE